MAASACQDSLEVANTNEPDGETALARPAEVEALIGSSYQAVFAASQGGQNVQPQALVMSMESFSNLANFGMALRSSIPRNPIDNTRGNAAAGGNYNDFLNLHRAARQAATGLAKVNDPAFVFFPPSVPQKTRARAMAHFVIGAALGNVALVYEQGSAVSPNDPAAVTNPPPLALIAHDTLMRYALSELDSAFNIANVAAAASGFPSPNGWFGQSGNAGSSLTQAQFLGLVRAYRARFRAGVARNPVERAAVDWPTVIADAQAGAAAFPADFTPPMNNTVGWDVVWFAQHFQSNSTNWHMMSQFMIGMADTTGAYDAWLAAPSAGKAPFLVVTGDRRFPQGTTRAAQQAVGGNSGTFVLPAGVYLRNRSIADWAGDPLANSFYDHFRFRPIFNAASRALPHPIFSTAEMNMLAAEGLIRGNQFDAAAALINITRVARGVLPALPNGMTAATPVPGSATGCIPRIPAAPAYTSAICGNMMEAMKWEKRMETAYTAAYGWYQDSRGWGDLPEGTALWWPVPYQEIDSRQLGASPPPYTGSVGGIGQPGGAARGTYGL